MAAATATDLVPEDLLHTLGERVRTRRLELELSQEQLGEIAGLHRNYIGGIEHGRRNVALVNLVRLALALELDPGELMKRIHRRR